MIRTGTQKAFYPVRFVLSKINKKEQHRIVAKVDELMAICDTLKTNLSEAQTTQIHLADTMAEQAMA